MGKEDNTAAPPLKPAVAVEKKRNEEEEKRIEGERERKAVREVRKKKKMENEWGGSVWFNVYRVGY